MLDMFLFQKKPTLSFAENNFKSNIKSISINYIEGFLLLQRKKQKERKQVKMKSADLNLNLLLQLGWT